MELNLEGNQSQFEDEPIMAGGKAAPAENWRLREERNVWGGGRAEGTRGGPLDFASDVLRI